MQGDGTHSRASFTKESECMHEIQVSRPNQKAFSHHKLLRLQEVRPVQPFGVTQYARWCQERVNTRTVDLNVELTKSHWIVRDQNNQAERVLCQYTPYKVTAIHYDLKEHRMASAVCPSPTGSINHVLI